MLLCGFNAVCFKSKNKRGVIMKKNRRILNQIAAACTSAVLFATMFNVNALAAVKEDDVTLLNRIGISAVYDENALITRGDFTVLAVQALCIDTLAEEMVFSDVKGIQGKYISTAARMGLVKINDEGLFYPDRVIKLEEAVAICLRILGYEEILKNTVYPNDYIAQASKLNLTKGVAVGSQLTGADAAELIFRTLDAEFIEQRFFTSNAENIYTQSDNTYLNEKFGVYKIRGQITSVREFALNRYKVAGEKKIRIGNSLYENPYYNDYDSYKYLGRYVEAYVMSTRDGREVVFIDDRSEIKTVDFRDVEMVRGFSAADKAADKKAPTLIYYDRERKKNEPLKLSADATALINRQQSVSLRNEDFIGETGEITLIDGDDNGIYDVVIIEKYKYYYVSYFDEASGVIVDKYRKESIDVTKFDDDDIFVLSDGKEIGLDAVVGDSVLEVMCSYLDDGSIDYSRPISLSVKTQTVEGRIDGVGEDGIFYINDKEYEVLDVLCEELKSRIGDSTTFLLGDDNLIVAYEDFSDGVALEYGYLVAIANEKSIGYDFAVRLFTTNEEMLTLKLSDDLCFTGVYERNYVINKRIKKEKILSTILPKQLIKYQLDENGNVALIELAYDYSTDSTYKGYENNRFSLDWKSDSATMLTGYLGETYRTNQNTLVFYVDTTSTDEKDFSVGYHNSKGYRIGGLKAKAYDSTQSLIAQVVVIEDCSLDDSGSYDSVFASSISIVKDKRKVRNEDGEFVTSIELYEDYRLSNFSPTDENLAPVNERFYDIPTTVNTFDDLEKGDVIFYSLSRKREIERYLVVGEYDENHTPTPYWEEYSNLYPGLPYARFNRVQGQVTSFEPGSYITVDGSGEQKFCFKRQGVVYCEYNVANKTIERYTNIAHINVGDYVWLYANKNDIKYIVRYIKD